MFKRSTIIFCLLCITALAKAQEHVGVLGYRAIPASNESGQKSRSAKKTTALSLPFFEDFTNNSFYPDTSKWLDFKVYINNTMGVEPVSRGVATFDAIDVDGLPYQKVNKSTISYADSLTSQKIDLSGYSASDSVYLSFFYQPQGNGFDPQPEDSLMLYFRKTSGWTRVWRIAGEKLKPFTQVMIPITQSAFFYDEFQFRFVNKASINNADDNWHIDYIRLDANRNINDTAVNDVAFIEDPTPILGEYTSMPYFQFLANAANERALQHETAIRNNNNIAVNINHGYTAIEPVTATPLGSASASATVQGMSIDPVSFPVYTNTVSSPGRNEAVTFLNKYYIESNANTGPVGNDTIIHNQLFHNFFAYDDGSAEKSYYLKLFTTLPGKIAIEYNLNEPDTLKGMAIYFGRQVPLAYQKYFSLAVYGDINYAGGSDKLLYQEDFQIPAYLSQQSFWYYKFAKPVVLPAGKFYIGTIQPALSGSDSLYFGLDVNRAGDNHVFYSVLDYWQPSSIVGAVMMRPLFGEFFPSIVSGNIVKETVEWDITPNPAADKIRFRFSSNDPAIYDITDMQGRMLRNGTVKNNEFINIADLQPGVYIVHFSVDGELSMPKKIVKL